MFTCDAAFAGAVSPPDGAPEAKGALLQLLLLSPKMTPDGASAQRAGRHMRKETCPI